MPREILLSEAEQLEWNEQREELSKRNRVEREKEMFARIEAAKALRERLQSIGFEPDLHELDPYWLKLRLHRVGELLDLLT